MVTIHEATSSQKEETGDIESNNRDKMRSSQFYDFEKLKLIEEKKRQFDLQQKQEEEERQ